MRVVVAHSGARDGYHVPRALSEAGMLDRLVTDLYWPRDTSWAALCERLIPAKLARLLRLRSSEGLPARQVTSCWFSGVCALAATKAKFLPFGWRRQVERWADSKLGARAGGIAASHESAMLSYSYYGHSAFSRMPAGVAKILFQVHPHPGSVRAILQQELRKHPNCAESLNREWEMGLPQEDFARLVDETRMAGNWIAASSFTRQTLIDHGAPAAKVHVIPYGVDCERFRPRGAADARERRDKPFELLFVGTINQRKGISYLLESMRLLKSRQVKLTVCGRVVDDLSMFKQYAEQVEVRASVSHAELLEAYRAADLFVFPSLAEGFGHVLLEAMASGLPVVSTARTALPDILKVGKGGYLVTPGDSFALAERIAWCLDNREQVAELGRHARATAEQFTWARFRHGVADTVQTILNPYEDRTVEREQLPTTERLTFRHV